MTNKLRIIFIIQASVAFVIIFLLNYFALNLSIGWSILGGLVFVLVVGGWALYRLKKYREKERKKAESDPAAGKS